MQETLLAKLKRNPKEVLRGVKKAVMAPMNEQLLTSEIRENFSLFPIR
jgi:hypothetical protein